MFGLFGFPLAFFCHKTPARCARRSGRVHLQEIHLQIQSFKIFKQTFSMRNRLPRRTHECFKPQICKMAVSSSSQTDFPPDMKAGNRLRRPFQLLGSSLKQNNGVAAFGSWKKCHEFLWQSMFWYQKVI